MADIVEDFLQRLGQHAPSTTPEARARLEQDMRQHWGGSEVYVGKRVSRTTRTGQIAHDLRQQVPLREAFARAGVSRRTGYRILGSK